MKHLLLILLSIVALSGRAQISDFTIAKPEFEKSISIIHRVISDTDCIGEYNYKALPDTNHLMVFDLTIINMGQHDAGFPNVADENGNILPDSVLHEMGLHWDPCHWHVHAAGIFVVYLEDVCGNVIDSSAKIGFNFQDMGNIMLYLQSFNGYELNAWLNTFGTPSYILAMHPANDNFNGDTRMGLSAAHYDTYSGATFGNSIRAHAPGDYYIRPVLNVSRWFDEGFNIFPNTFRTPITITPQETIVTYQHTTVCPPPCDAGNPDPMAISVTGNVVSWDSTGACDFNDLEILVWNDKRDRAEYRVIQTVEIATQTSHIHNGLSERDLQRYARQLPWTFNGGKYSYGYKIGNTIYKP